MFPTHTLSVLIVLIDRVQQLLVLGCKIQRLDADQCGPTANIAITVVTFAHQAHVELPKCKHLVQVVEHGVLVAAFIAMVRVGAVSMLDRSLELVRRHAHESDSPVLLVSQRAHVTVARVVLYLKIQAVRPLGFLMLPSVGLVAPDAILARRGVPRELATSFGVCRIAPLFVLDKCDVPFDIDEIGLFLV